ncbi:hypothetical protein SESBI_43605 [Sesbania bispinosa]|nr:hypothetical protein SESBI_43605 [Sesbania bispinosa]
MKNEVSFKKKLNTQEKGGKGAFNIEGQVKSSAELRRLFKIKCEKVEVNIEGTKASREEGPNNKQFKPPTVATVPTKTKEFEQGKAKELEKFQLHATQNKGAGKIPTTNSQGQKKMPIQAGNSNVQLHPTQSKGVGQIPPTNSQGQRKCQYKQAIQMCSYIPLKAKELDKFHLQTANVRRKCQYKQAIQMCNYIPLKAKELEKFHLQTAKEKYIIPDIGKKAVFARINDAWRRYKNFIKRKYFLNYPSLKERLKNRPKSIPENHFRALMTYWTNSEVQDVSKKML